MTFSYHQGNNCTGHELFRYNKIMQEIINVLIPETPKITTKNCRTNTCPVTVITMSTPVERNGIHF